LILRVLRGIAAALRRPAHLLQLLSPHDRGIARVLRRRAAVLRRRNAMLRRHDAVLRRTSPVLRRTSPVLRRTSPVLRRTSPVLRRTSPVLRREDRVFRGIAPLVRRTACLLRSGDAPLLRASPLLSATSPLLRGASRLEQFTDDREQFRRDATHCAGGTPYAIPPSDQSQVGQRAGVSSLSPRAAPDHLGPMVPWGSGRWAIRPGEVGESGAAVAPRRLSPSPSGRLPRERGRVELASGDRPGAYRSAIIGPALSSLGSSRNCRWYSLA
jgi:hypothetical protein